MKAQHTRAALAAANVALVGIIAWVTVDTFYRVDKTRYDPPTFPVAKLLDALERRKQTTEQRTLSQYAVVWNQLGRKAPPRPVESQVKPVDPPTVRPVLEVLAMTIDADPARCSAILRNPQTGAERPFFVGEALSNGKGFEGFRGHKVREIRALKPGLPPAETDYVIVIEDDRGGTFELGKKGR